MFRCPHTFGIYMLFSLCYIIPYPVMPFCCPFRFPLEVHVQSGEAAVLRRASQIESAAPGTLPRLQIQTPTKAHLYCRGKTTAGGRVQSHDEEPTTGATSNVPSEVMPVDVLNMFSFFRDAFSCRMYSSVL